MGLRERWDESVLSVLPVRRLLTAGQVIRIDGDANKSTMPKPDLDQIITELQINRQYLDGLKEDLSDHRIDREKLLADIERLRQRLAALRAAETND